MKRLPLIAALALLATPLVSALAADVGVSISVGDPGFYGRLDIGNYPPPQVIYTRPVIVERPVVRVVEEPLYLRVPVGHTKNWRHYCGQYNACGRQVYFVQDTWYRETYVPRYREHHGHPWDEGEHRHHDDDDHDRDHRDREHDHGHHRGHGHDRHHD